MSLRPRPGEAGSAYLLALLVLVVLTLLGLSLALVGQAEQQMGAAALQAERAFYGAEAGMQMGLAQLLTVQTSVEDVTLAGVVPATLTIADQRWQLGADGSAQPVPDGAATPHLGARVELSPFVPIRDGYCDMCRAGEGDLQLRAVDHAVVATAERVHWTGEAASAGEPLAQGAARKQLFSMVGLAPWFAPRWDAIADDSQVQRVVQETLGDS